jgi:translation initiation factor IF-3
LRGRRRFRKAPLPPPEDTRARINDRIRVPQILLIDQDGNKIGAIATEEARRMATVAELDLVEVAPNARPPVCRIMDYGKFLFEQQRKERAQKRKSATQEVKEIRLRPGTGQGDLDIKAKHAREFIEEGYKVGIQLLFRGRERAHPELAVEMIKKFAAMIKDVAKIEQMPRQEGRRMNALLAPLKKGG